MCDYSRVFRNAVCKKSTVQGPEHFCIRIYISCYVFNIYTANVEMQVTVCWVDGYDKKEKKSLKFLLTVNVCIKSNHNLLNILHHFSG